MRCGKRKGLLGETGKRTPVDFTQGSREIDLIGALETILGDRPGIYGAGLPLLSKTRRQFDAMVPGKAGVANIIYIQTSEGFAYLAVVISPYSQRVIGWGSRFAKRPMMSCCSVHGSLEAQAGHQVLIRSDQGSQFASMGWLRRKVYRPCEEARQNVFDYIEMVYNQNT